MVKELKETRLQADSVFAAMRQEPFGLIAVVCVFAGLPISEALGLRWRDLDVAVGSLTVAGQLGRDGAWLPQVKTGSSAATLPLLPVLQRELRAHRQKQAAKNLTLVKADGAGVRAGAGEATEPAQRCACATDGR